MRGWLAVGVLFGCGARSALDVPADASPVIDAAHDASTCVAPQPLVIAIGAPVTKTAIAQDADFLYWIDADGVVRTPKCGGEVTVLAAEQHAQGVVTLGSSVYFTVDSNQKPWGVYFVGSAGGTTTRLAKTEMTVSSPVTDGASFFMIGDSATLLRVDLDGTVVHLLPTAVVSNTAVDATFVYTRDESDGSILRIPKNGGTPSILTKTAQLPHEFLVDDTTLYLALGSLPRIQSVPKTGGPQSMVGFTAGDVADMTSDTTHVYIAEGTGHIERFAKSERVLQTVAFEPNWPVAIAVDARSVYWLDTSGRMTKLDKP